MQEGIGAKNSIIVSVRDLAYLGLWLIVPLCSITSHTVLPVPPTLLFFVIGSFILLPIIFIRKKVLVSDVMVVPVIMFAYVLIFQLYLGAPFTRFSGVILPLLYFLIVVMFLPYLDSERRFKLGSAFVNISIVVFVLECIWRLTHPDLKYAQFAEAGDVRWIYQYKAAGLMYSDSNAVGIHLVIILFFIFYLEKKSSLRWPIGKIVLVILLILTFSRAAWFGGITGWIYVRYLSNKNAMFFIVNGIILAIVAAVAIKYFVLPKLESDLSFQSKFMIINATIKFLREASPTELLFGVGFSNSIERLGVYAHNYFMVFLTESGVVGLMLVIVLFASFVIYTSGETLIVLVPFVLTTLSSTVTFTPFFYVVLAFIFVEYQSRLAERPWYED